MNNEVDDAKVLQAFEVLMKIYENKVFSETERQQATEAGLRDFRALLKKRLLEHEKGLPTVDEVGGLKSLALDFLNHSPKFK